MENVLYPWEIPFFVGMIIVGVLAFLAGRSFGKRHFTKPPKGK
jgi:hypothetical protein